MIVETTGLEVKPLRYRHACAGCGLSLTCGRRTLRHRCAPSCQHLGDPTGEIALVPCRTCEGNVRKKMPVHRCAVWGVCVPAAEHADGQQLAGCRGCLRRIPTPPAARAAGLAALDG